jgi:hypothetical protein
MSSLSVSTAAAATLFGDDEGDRPDCDPSWSRVQKLVICAAREVHENALSTTRPTEQDQALLISALDEWLASGHVPEFLVSVEFQHSAVQVRFFSVTITAELPLGPGQVWNARSLGARSTSFSSTGELAQVFKDCHDHRHKFLVETRIGGARFYLYEPCRREEAAGIIRDFFKNIHGSRQVVVVTHGMRSESFGYGWPGNMDVKIEKMLLSVEDPDTLRKRRERLAATILQLDDGNADVAGQCAKLDVPLY